MQDVVVLAGQTLEGALIVVDPVPQDDPDDPPLLVGEQVVEPVDPAFEIARDQRRDVGQRAPRYDSTSLRFRSAYGPGGAGGRRTAWKSSPP